MILLPFKGHLKPHIKYYSICLCFKCPLNGSKIRAPFTREVMGYGAEHRFIPPGMCNANGDVESIHHLIEKEFFDLTEYESRTDFITKAESYRLFFNLERPNSSKGGKTPWLIAQQNWPDTDIASHVALIKAIALDRMAVSGYNKRGQSFPAPAEIILIK